MKYTTPWHFIRAIHRCGNRAERSAARSLATLIRNANAGNTRAMRRACDRIDRAEIRNPDSKYVYEICERAHGICADAAFTSIALRMESAR